MSDRYNQHMSEPTLKTHFTASTRDDWLALVDKGLRGAAYESLIHKTEDGIPRGPLMTAADLPPHLAPLARTDLPLLEGRAWHIAAPVRDPDLAHANQQLLEDLKGGASAIRIETGTILKDRNDLKRLLEGVYTDLVPIHFAPTIEYAAMLEMALSIKDLRNAHLHLGLNPLQDSQTIQNALINLPETWRLMLLVPSEVHEQGGTDVQELSIMAASMADAMRRHGAETVCRNLSIELATDRDTHMTIAKFRAARRIILRIAEGFGVDGATIPLQAITSLRMMQTEDAWTNMLRVMSAGFGAVIGGADMVTTRPFTDGLGKATPLAHRIARNMQLMMMEESHLGQVVDAAYGSYWHESMSEKIAQAAWADFQHIERLGGIEAYLESNQHQAKSEESKANRDERGEPILGVTLHASDSVKEPEVRT